MLDEQALTKIRSQFPLLNQTVNGHPLAYLDNASTMQKPERVIKAITDFYTNTNSNVHRGIHDLSQQATELFESTRHLVADFINATPEEIIFTRGTTESINLVAYTWGEENIKEGDEIIVSILEHHSNFVPWQQLAKRKNATLKIIPILSDYTLDMEAYKSMLSDKTKLVAITAMSNVLGTTPDLKEIITLAHEHGALTLVDAAQAIAHSKTDVKDLDADFLAFSAHKMFGPTGVGVLYGKRHLLEKMPPFQFGGDMIKSVTIEESTWNDLPYKFEAGTPNIADIIAFAEAIKFIQEVGLENINAHTKELITYAIEKFSAYPEVKLLAPPINQSGPVLSFTIERIHPHDIAEIFNQEGVAIRSGHHCAQPLMEALGIPATARLSFAIYNTKEEIDQAEQALIKTIWIFTQK